MPRQLARVPAPNANDGDAADDPLLSFQAEQDIVSKVPGSETAKAASAPPVRPRPLVIAAATIAVVTAVGAGLTYYYVRHAPAAVAAAPVAVPTGTVSFTSEPTGATVTIDGVTRGVTPLKITVPQGQHEARITLGASDRILPLAVDANAVIGQHFEFSAASITRTGRLDVTTDPPGARVSVDGQPRGNTPLSIASIGIGEHKVTISNDSTTVQRTVTVSAGATATIMASVTANGAAGGWAQIKSPIELQVFEGNQLIGTTSAARLMLPAGRHDLEVTNAALEFRTSLRVDIEAGKTAAAAVAVPNGTISVNALPWADIAIDGRAVGTTPLGNLSVPIGTHEIVFRHPQLGERTRTVLVTARTPVRVGMDFSK